jgi:hypothetical protein
VTKTFQSPFDGGGVSNGDQTFLVAIRHTPHCPMATKTGGMSYIFGKPLSRTFQKHLIDLGAFIWKVMSFGVKNGPPTYQKVVTKTFRKYLDSFMKIFLDDFTVYSEMENHLLKFKLCFQKCK